MLENWDIKATQGLAIDLEPPVCSVCGLNELHLPSFIMVSGAGLGVFTL